MRDVGFSEIIFANLLYKLYFWTDQQQESTLKTTVINIILKLVLSILIFFGTENLFAVDADKITSLSFEKTNPKSGWASAQDQEGNTWIKGEIPAFLLSRQIVMQVPSSHIIDYDLYIYKEGQLVRPEVNINGYGQDVRPRYPLYYFSTEIPVYYLNIKDNPVYKLKTSVMESGQYLRQESSNLMRIYLYYGMISMAVIFNIVFFLIFLDKHFAIYTLLQANLLFIFFLEDGMLYYINPSIAQHFHYFLMWSISVSAILAVVFTYYLLDLKQYNKRFKSITSPIIILLVIGLLAYTWTGNSAIRMVISIFCFSLSGLCFYQAAMLFKNHIYARFLLLAFGFIVLMGGLYTLNEYFESPFLSLFDVDGMRFASAVEVVAISFALIYKVRSLRSENARYRTELRHYMDLLQASRQYEKDSNNIPEHNGTALPDHTNDLLTEIEQKHALTEREREVLECIWNGASNQEISNKLNISVNTAKFHVSRLYNKLDVKNRSEVRMLKRELRLPTSP